MGNKKKKKQAASAAAGSHAKSRHQKKARHHERWASAGQPPAARLPAPVIKSKHRTYLEFVENTDKKKKLEFEVTTAREPPPGFEFVPVGNPDLTKACKELSREHDAMIFIVSLSKGAEGSQLGFHMNRIGHHIRRTIVEEARALLGQPKEFSLKAANGDPEPIPETQDEINAQADAVIRDLFPRMPNTDRQIIIDRSFQKGAQETVGLAADLTLSRRVQLAVLAHIRHTHTRYDMLIREVGWSNARKAVESVCLDFLVKWRGDEETGRDQLDEILREIIVISDSEESDSDDDEDSEDDASDESGSADTSRGSLAADNPPLNDHNPVVLEPRGDPHISRAQPDVNSRQVSHRRLNSRNMRRYEAAASSRWEQAQERVRRAPLSHEVASLRPAPGSHGAMAGFMDRTHSQQMMRQSYNTFGRPSLARDHGQVDHQLRQEPGLRGSLQPSLRAREPMPLYQGGNRQSVSRGGIPGINGNPNPVNYRVPNSAAPEPTELKDFLVPSIEPMSPQADDSSAPVFVRSLPPRQQQPLQPQPQLQPPGYLLRRRSRSPLQRMSHPPSLLSQSRERDTLPGRFHLTEEHRYTGAGIPAGSATFAQGRSSERRGEVDFQSSRPWEPHRDVRISGPRETHMATYPRAVPNDGNRSTVMGSRPIASENRDSPLLRTERHPIVVEDWGNSSERVLLLPSRRTHQEPSYTRYYDGTTRIRGLSSGPPVTLGRELVAPNGERAATARDVYYERRPAREYMPAPSAFSQHPSIPARPPSPLYYQRVGYADQRPPPPFENGYTSRFEPQFSGAVGGSDGRVIAPGVPEGQQLPGPPVRLARPSTHSEYHQSRPQPRQPEYIQID